jgi:hypothetical protein
MAGDCLDDRVVRDREPRCIGADEANRSRDGKKRFQTGQFFARAGGA